MLFPGINLTKLKLIALSPDGFDGEQSRLLPVTQAASESEGMAATTAPHAMVDHCVWKCLVKQVYGMRFPTSAYFSLI